MDEQNIPIDINTNKLLDWLISRRHVTKDWQNEILKVREKINSAIQDMPVHEGILKLLSGQHINYFHCLKIIEILKETEKDSKNIFGMYGSQRMKDWQDIVYLYQKDNIYLAEAAQVLIRNVSYEIPSLKKQITKIQQTQAECEKKIKDYNKTEATAVKEFNASCEQLGISGNNIPQELIGLLKELPQIYSNISKEIKTIKPAVDLYAEFNKFLSGRDIEVLNILKYLIENGNTTTYEYTYGEKPIKIEEPVINASATNESEPNSEEIDFGDIDFGENGNSIDFGDSPDDQTNSELNIDWGNNEEGFEIVNYEDVDVNLEESGIVVEKSGMDGGIAKGNDALTILDNPKTREKIINNLLELDTFLKMRLYEISSDSDLLSMSQMQEAPSILQMQTIESVTSLCDHVNIVLTQLTNKRITHLHNIKHSPKYVDILSASLKQKLSVIDRMKENKALLEKKVKELGEEAKHTEPIIKLFVEKTKQLQREIEEDISKKYKGRVVNIVGAVNML